MTYPEPIETPLDRAEIGVATITGQAAGVLHRMSTPKERPILFSAPMVRAILEGRKTQTRRIVKPQPDPKSGWETQTDLAARCPLGRVPGDRLWVRETWQQVADMGFGDGRMETIGEPCENSGHPVLYLADCPNGKHPPRWRPSIHMPRWASRITLEVVSVRVERLQDISFADCRSEGCDPDYSEHVTPCERCDGNDPCTGRHTGEKWHFSRIWGSIHGPGSWALNPWVWVVEFRRIDR